MQSDITPRPRTDFSSGPTVHRGDYGLTPAAIAANQPAPTAIQIPVADVSAPVAAVVTPVAIQIPIVEQLTPVAPITAPAPSAPPMPKLAVPIVQTAELAVATPVSAPVSTAPVLPTAPALQAFIETPVALPLPIAEPTIASAVAHLEVDPIVTTEPAAVPLPEPVNLQTSADATLELDADFTNLDMGQKPTQFVTPLTASTVTTVPTSINQPTDNGHFDAVLQSVSSAPAAAPALDAKQPSAMKRWLSEHKKPVRVGVAAIALLFVGFSGLGLYQGYTKDTPYVSIAAPKPVAPTAAKATAKLASASFADNSDDDKRQTAIKSLHEAIEAYYVKNGFYPTANQMQTLSWIAANFKNFDMTQLKDPAGSTAGVVAAPGKGVYAYQVSTDQSMRACDNDFANCNYYILTATMSDGSAYTSIAIQ